ncbi:superoxide dismutase [Stenotrophomonas daejeonensis]|uniref:Superoxide dismutase [Cu-Zn] n=1 Tax=Stenotrophomonas daejeonensis TaxID=659018 RepID=A0A0R0E0B1_9GAMM|nr:superoxide dismutase family protein [Stenotrophomonas daejeonensis]KRG87301.1 superoxide dismutase [Stenotrophomonas daejeonensis]
MRFRLPLLPLAGATLLGACATQPPAEPPAPPAPPAVSTAQLAEANLAPASASLVSGRLALVPEAGGVHITGVIGGLPRGRQVAFHVHEKGDCSAVDAASAGGHFNPAAQPHGRAGSGTHHAGDMDNLQADAAGVVHMDMHLHGVTLGGGAANDIAGRALVVHADADDYRSQPAGNAGARVACGVIRVTR